MYPPLDPNSNDIGGKGSSGHQDTLVGKKWDGGDVPASIIEAGKLFASRTKMTRAVRQLWEEREKFLKYDRGWDENETGNKSDSNPEQKNESDNVLENSTGQKSDKHSQPTKESDDEDVQRRLDAVDEFYVGLSARNVAGHRN